MPLPSPRFIGLVLVSVPLFLAGIFDNSFATVGIVYATVLAMVAVTDLLLLRRRTDVAVERRSPNRLSLEVPGHLVYRLHNRGSAKVDITLAEVLPDSVEGGKARCTLAAGEKRNVGAELIGRRRGRHSLAVLDLRVLPAVGLFAQQWTMTQPADVDVYPNLHNLRRYELLLRRGTMDQGLARLRQLGLGSEFESLRQYSDGDDMGRVDWKATAKRSRLIVRNLEAERQQSVLVAIDVGRATAGEIAGVSRLDHLINAALMLGYVSLRQGDWFSLVGFSDRIETYLPPTRGHKNVDQVARALYRLEARLVESDYAGACRFLGLKNRKRSLIVLMTDVIDRQASDVVIAYLARFARHHLPMAVTLLDPAVLEEATRPLFQHADPFSKAAAQDVIGARQAALLDMRRRGVAVLDVAPSLLTPSLINRYLTIKTRRRL